MAACALAGLAALAAAAPAAGARTIDVHPGRDAIGEALDEARSGDRLRIHGGRYHEAPQIDKRVKLLAAAKRRPVIDGDCETRFVIDVRHGGVRLERLEVVGASEGFGPVPSAVNFAGVPTGTAKELVLRDTCDAEYGINVLASERVRLVDNLATGFSDAGLYVGEITSTGGGVLLVRDNDAYGNTRGMVVENSAGGDIRVMENAFQDNTIPGEGTPSGIFVTNSDGVLLERNAFRDNGQVGIHLTSNSDFNRLFENTAEGHTTDLLNEGSGNCGSGNAFVTTAGNPLPPC